MKNMKTVGIGLIVLSGLLWLALPGIPFLPLSNWWKGTVAVAILALAEITFWAGSAMVGASVWKKIKDSKAVLWLKNLLLPSRRKANKVRAIENERGTRDTRETTIPRSN